MLIVHQQILANALRKRIREQVPVNVTVASWFELDKMEKEEGDIFLKEEDQWISLMKEEKYDVVIADNLFARAVPEYAGEYWNLPHFAVSGKRKG